MSNVSYSMSGTILMLSIKVHKINKSCLLFLVLLILYVCCLVTKSCLTLCNPMDSNLPGSSVHGISQTRILEWVAIFFSRDLPQPGIQPTSPTLSSGFFIHLTVQISQPADFLWSNILQHARLPCPSATRGACSDSCPLSHWCYPTISSSVIPFFSRLQSFPASESFPMSQLFASGGQSIEASASAWVLPMNIQDVFSLELTGLISLLSKGLSRVFSNTTVQKH